MLHVSRRVFNSFVFVYSPAAHRKDSVHLTVQTLRSACLLRALLTPWSRIIQKQAVLQLVKKFHKCYEIHRLIAAFTTACHLYLSWATSISCPTPAVSRSFFLLQDVQTGSGDHRASNRYRGSPPPPAGGKAAVGWCWPLTSTKRRNQEWVELYFHPSHTPSWHE